MEQNSGQHILVYTDFTEAGDIAVEHGASIAKIFNKELSILHVIDDNTKSMFGSKNTGEAVFSALQETCADIANKYDLKVNIHSSDETRCNVINELSQNIDAMMVIMGIHGRNEIQYLTPKYALKIIRNSKVPFLMVQKKGSKDNQYKNIVISVNHLKETKEKISWASYFGKLNNSIVHILVSKGNDIQTKNNVLFAKKIFKEFNTEFKTYNTEKSWVKLDKYALTFARQFESVFIIIMTTKQYDIPDHIFGPAEQRIISNKSGIPVMCLNSRTDLYVPCV